MTQILWTAANLVAMAVLAWITLRHKKKGELDYTITASPPESEAGGFDLEPPMASRLHGNPGCTKGHLPAEYAEKLGKKLHIVYGSHKD